MRVRGYKPGAKEVPVAVSRALKAALQSDKMLQAMSDAHSGDDDFEREVSMNANRVGADKHIRKLLLSVRHEHSESHRRPRSRL